MKLKDFDFRIWDNIENKYIKTSEGLYIENTEHNDASNCNRIIENYDHAGFAADHPYNWKNKEYYNNENAFSIELFTGLYDKNGNKIYEGDVLFSFEGCSEGEAFKYKAVLKEGAFYLVECGDDGEEYDEDLISEFRLEELEIVGNIHENKELLNVRL
ncbi:TPA: YopX family protein [Campylobacter jejuni]